MDLLLFDLGGVLVKNNAFDVMKRLSDRNVSVETIKEKWSNSSAVEQFESGMIGKDEFAKRMVHDFQFLCSHEEFLIEFANWIEKPFDGAIELLEKLKKHFNLACLSNTNEVHQHKFMTEWNFHEYFDYSFFSHEMGCLKPGKDIYEMVINSVPQDVVQIHFFDDSKVNVQAAEKIGINAYVIESFEGLKNIIEYRWPDIT